MATTAAPLRRILLLDTSHYHPIASGTIEYAREAGWMMMFATMHNATPAQMAKRWGAEGLIGGVAGRTGTAAWWQCPLPFVNIDDMPPKRCRAANVLLDFRASGALAAQHFIDSGFRHLAYCWLGDVWGLNHQLEGFRQAGQAGGATVHNLDWRARTRRYWQGSSKEFRRWLVDRISKLPKPLGLMVESDWSGLEAQAAFQAAGVLVPDEVAIVSCFNEEPICNSAPVPLSSVDMNWHEHGYRAAAVLDGLLNGAPLPAEPVWIGPKGVVVRQSSNVTAVAHPGVARAMNIIRESFRDAELTVGSLARKVGISTFWLNKACRKYLGQTPGERLRQWRLREAMALLATTDRAIKDIASDCGYGTVDQLIRCVRAATGLPPRAWRKKNANPPEES